MRAVCWNASPYHIPRFSIQLLQTLLTKDASPPKNVASHMSLRQQTGLGTRPEIRDFKATIYGTRVFARRINANVWTITTNPDAIEWGNELEYLGENAIIE